MEVKSNSIEAGESSVRIFFAKESALSTIWHLCDAALGSDSTLEGIRYKALHGSMVRAEVRADTVLQADLARKPNESLCEQCMEEYQLATKFIRDNRLLKFE